MRPSSCLLAFICTIALAPFAFGSEHGKPAEHGNPAEHGASSEHGAAPEHGASAEKEEAVHLAYNRNLKERPAKTSSRDVKLPHALVAKIETDYKEYIKTQTGQPAKESIRRQLINISAELTQKNHAALSEDVRVVTPLGGGVVDFNELVTPLRGAFNVRLVPTNEKGEGLSTTRVFFVSRAKARILAGETYGAGCDKFMEITSRFHKKWSTSGFDVYTADQRYASVLGGTFVFVDYQKEALWVGAVAFTDSRHNDLYCE